MNSTLYLCVCEKNLKFRMLTNYVRCKNIMMTRNKLLLLLKKPWYSLQAYKNNDFNKVRLNVQNVRRSPLYNVPSYQERLMNNNLFIENILPHIIQVYPEFEFFETFFSFIHPEFSIMISFD